MKPSRIQTVLTSLLKQRWPAFLWGPPGVGKSSVVRSVAEQSKLPVLDIRASLLDPTDLRGIPAVQNSKAVWCPPAFLPEKGEPPGVLFLDEINAAPPLVQASLYQLVLDRQIGEYRLPDGWWIVAAGNRQGDKSLVFRLSAALANRFIHIDFEPNSADWRDWAISRRIHPLIVGFIGFKPSLLLAEPGDSPAYPTPRSWEIVSDLILAFGSIQACRDLIPGAIGEGAAVEFLAFSENSLREKDFLAIVDNPETANLPTSLGEIYALTSWLAYHGQGQSVREAAAILLSRIPPEFAVVLARDMLKASSAFLKEGGYKEFISKHGKLLV